MENKRVEPKTIAGFMELLPNEQILFNQMMDTIRKSYESFGFLPIDTPIIEGLTLIDGKSYQCTYPMQVIMRVKAKTESTIGDCTTTITRRSVKVLKN